MNMSSLKHFRCDLKNQIGRFEDLKDDQVKHFNTGNEGWYMFGGMGENSTSVAELTALMRKKWVKCSEPAKNTVEEFDWMVSRGEFKFIDVGEAVIQIMSLIDGSGLRKNVPSWYFRRLTSGSFNECLYLAEGDEYFEVVLVGAKEKLYYHWTTI